MKMPLSRLIDYTPSPEGAVVCLLTCVPKWNKSQILVGQMTFCSIPLRVHGKVVILQCRSGTFRAYSVTAPKGSRQHRKTEKFGSEGPYRLLAAIFCFLISLGVGSPRITHLLFSHSVFWASLTSLRILSSTLTKSLISLLLLCFDIVLYYCLLPQRWKLCQD